MAGSERVGLMDDELWNMKTIRVMVMNRNYDGKSGAFWFLWVNFLLSMAGTDIPVASTSSIENAIMENAMNQVECALSDIFFSVPRICMLDKLPVKPNMHADGHLAAF